MPGLGESSSQADTTKSNIRLLRERVVRWGMPIVRSFQDEHGVYCLKIETCRGRVYCITKEYPYQELASFPARVVRRANANETPIAVFFGEPQMGNAYVYRPSLVAVEGAPNKDTAPAGRRQTWIDIPLDDGVLFGHWISDRSDLHSQSPDEQPPE